VESGEDPLAVTRDVAELKVDPESAVVYEHGWQSWSPSTAYRLDQRPYRPVSEALRLMNSRPDRHAPTDAFQGEGLLAVDPGDGEIHVFGAGSATGPIASVRADVRGNNIVVSADADVRHDVERLERLVLVPQRLLQRHRRDLIRPHQVRVAFHRGEARVGLRVRRPVSGTPGTCTLSSRHAVTTED